MDNMTLSYSSATLLRGCQTRFYNYKNKIEADSDYVDNTEALVIGTSFHYILEMSMHKKPEKIGNLLDYCCDTFGLDPDKKSLVHAMCVRYIRHHKTTGYECIKCEIEIGNDKVLGYVDAILLNHKTGGWRICDLKTCRSFYRNIIPKLPNDIQLNLYAYFAPQIAKELNLELDKFEGCEYRTTSKSVAKMKKNETALDFTKRLIEVVRTYFIFIPLSEMKPKEIYDRHIVDYKLAKKILDGKQKPTKNFSYCDSFFKPCAYWSKCHGSLFTESASRVELSEL